jgi:hypothetical protein
VVETVLAGFGRDRRLSAHASAGDRGGGKVISSTLSRAAASHFGKLIFWYQDLAPHYGEGIASNAAMLTPGIEM